MTEDLSLRGLGGTGQHSAGLQVLEWSPPLIICVSKEACLLLLFLTCPESAWVTEAIVCCLRLPSLSLHKEQGSNW